MSSRSKTLNKTGVEFLLTDLDAALTFMDIADGWENEQKARRNRENARKAYETVLRHLRNVKPDPRQQKAIEEKLTRLRTRLEAAGHEL